MSPERFVKEESERTKVVDNVDFFSDDFRCCFSRAEIHRSVHFRSQNSKCRKKQDF